MLENKAVLKEEETISNRNAKKWCELCSELTIQTLKQRQLECFHVDFEQVKVC